MISSTCMAFHYHKNTGSFQSPYLNLKYRWVFQLLSVHPHLHLLKRAHSLISEFIISNPHQTYTSFLLSCPQRIKIDNILHPSYWAGTLLSYLTPPWISWSTHILCPIDLSCIHHSAFKIKLKHFSMTNQTHIDGNFVYLSSFMFPVVSGWDYSEVFASGAKPGVNKTWSKWIILMQ